MKKAVVFSIVCLIVLSLMGCSNASSSTKTPSSNNSYVKPTQKTLSTSEKEEIAERETLKMLIKYMKESYKASTFGKYNIDATRVNVGSITEDRDNHFSVCGTLYLYDRYGSLEDTATFEGTVDIDDDGSYHAYYPSINIE